MQKIMLFFVVTFLGFIGCGKSSENKSVNKDELSNAKQTVEVDQEFLEYVNFIKQKLTNLEVTNTQLQKINFVSIRFGKISVVENNPSDASNDSSSETLGACKRPTDNRIKEFRAISIDLTKWTELSYKKKINLIAHELGHCAWDLEHNDSKNKVMSHVVSEITEGEWRYFAEQVKNSNE